MNNAIIIGHGKQRALHREIKALIEPFFDKMVAVTPRNDELGLYEEEYPIGHSDYNGYGTIDRTVFATLLAASFDGVTSIIEYDAIVWKGFFDYLAHGGCADRTVYCGAIFNEGDHSKFQGKQFTHWPVTATSATWHRIAHEIAHVHEDGFPDRMMGLAVEKAGCVFQQVGDAAFSANHIDAKQLPFALDAISRGAVCMHGIKDIATLKTLNNAYNALHANR